MTLALVEVCRQADAKGLVTKVSEKLASADSEVASHMSCRLNSFKGGYIGDYIGDYYRGY